MVKLLIKRKLKRGLLLKTLEEQQQASNLWGKTKPKSLKCNLQEPQLKSEGVSLGTLVQKCEENSL